MDKTQLKENSFDGAPGGSAGSVSSAPGWGTHSSPAVSQNPSKFGATSGYHTLPSNDTMSQSGSAELGKDVNQLMSKKDVPSVDDVVAGINWELGQMVVKDKRLAKEKVIANLKKNPHFYSDLDQLNINMDKTPEEIEKDRQMAERKKIFEEMISQRPQKYETKPELVNIMRDMWKAKQEKRFNA